MPLARVEVRNEYGLGGAEMYRQANKEEPKEILQGLAVAGLVGVLRQLGDLADFAAEIFHGLQEEVALTSSRSHELIGRAQRLEAELSPLEKSVLAQRSHLHFAYTTGSNWHAGIPCERNHFVHSDLPQFMFDSYEDCRGPPCLYSLDRFDPGGPGSCLERYSDPAFFNRASAASGEASIGKVPKDKGNKKQRLWPRNREIYGGASYSNLGGRTQVNVGEHSWTSLRADLREQSNSDWRNGSDNIKGDIHPSCSLHSEEQRSRDFHLDDFPSETDKFMDASSAIEPESETDAENEMSFWKIRSKISTADLDIKLGKKGHLLSPEYMECSSRITQLSNRLLKSTESDINLLHSGEGTSGYHIHKTGNDFELKSHQKLGYQSLPRRTKDSLLGESLILSPSSSPPLRHIKIYLQPIDGFETSKPKQKTPNGKTNGESRGDIFPSFHLVPETPITKQNIVGSDSDEETLSRRSSPSLSDNYQSHQSDQNPDHCETDESHGIKDLYDSLCKISFRDSIPTATRNIQSSLTALQNEPTYDTTPDPAPVPPVQWMSMKPHSDYTEDIFQMMPHSDYTEDIFQMMPKTSNYALNLKHSTSTISHQEPKPAPLDHDQILETRPTEKPNEGREAKQEKGIDEKEGFLQQIRAKSISLRPTLTIPAKQTVPSTSSSNVHVSAIVQKANKIRQAVGSDEGDEDGNWSDA